MDLCPEVISFGVLSDYSSRGGKLGIAMDKMKSMFMSFKLRYQASIGGIDTHVEIGGGASRTDVMAISTAVLRLNFPASKVP